MNKEINRRSFLKVIASTAVCLPAAGTLLQTQKVYALEVPSTELDASSPKAQQFGYHADASTVDAVKFPKKAGATGATQSCANCQLLVQSGLSVAGKTDKYGVCSLFQEGLVAEKGWCNMWVQKV